MKYLILLCGLFIYSKQQTPAVVIVLKNNTEKEVQAREQLIRILKNYKTIVRKCTFTDTVVIDESNRVPHSHPVLTLNTRYLDNDTIQLSNFVHEQLHWMIDANPTQRDKAIETVTALFPDAPAGPPTGARDKYSTYLHLLVCDVEYQAMIQAIGEPASRQLLTTRPYYTWIYEKVLTDKRIRETNRQSGFILPK